MFVVKKGPFSQLHLNQSSNVNKPPTRKPHFQQKFLRLERGFPYGHNMRNQSGRELLKIGSGECVAVESGSVLKQHEGYFGTDLQILNRGSTTRRTPELAPPLQTSAVPLGPTSDLTWIRLTNTSYLQWNRVSNLKPSGFEAETLPKGHHGLRGSLKRGDSSLSRG
ncbi:hypothetical protein AVEN_125013-1 [Araneus ventricosus]|uniref:Uncharacterized protein n=1 Tax=Araneus ventricosus TaxID=182803 RepID=A0A4Y2GZ78_ARAVE|nr:hypothetical protein AVEN_125013-1 [Araneus ventricosus]